jgi:hypothetical protein
MAAWQREPMDSCDTSILLFYMGNATHSQTYRQGVFRAGVVPKAIVAGIAHCFFVSFLNH